MEPSIERISRIFPLLVLYFLTSLKILMHLSLFDVPWIILVNRRCSIEFFVDLFPYPNVCQSRTKQIQASGEFRSFSRRLISRWLMGFAVNHRCIGVMFLTIVGSDSNDLSQPLTDFHSKRTNHWKYWSTRKKYFIQTYVLLEKMRLLCNPCDESPYSLHSPQNWLISE